MMDKPLRKKNYSDSEEFELKPKEKEQTTDFEGWFGSKVQTKELNPWQLNEVLIFFKKSGLSKQETWDTFEKCFARF